MGTDTAAAPAATGPEPLLSRQPVCRRCRHEEHWFSCEWCGCTAAPLQHAATEFVPAPA